MARIVGALTLCECCALWVENNDESSCREYYEHTHKRAEVPVGTSVSEEPETAWVKFTCDGCGEEQPRGANTFGAVILK